MPRVLTVDDSRAVRAIVMKQLKDLGCEVDEAEDGLQGLSKLEEKDVDLIVLDVTMPNMDGPTMLGKLMGAGKKTPVIMLTSEAKRSVVSGAMSLGIQDYILKPFKPEELVQKVRAALKMEAAPAAAAPKVEEGGEKKAAVDILVVDDMENVGKRLKSLLPAHVSFNAVTSGPAALTACREGTCRVILLDTEIPEVDSVVLAGQLKLLQPSAAIVALALKPGNKTAAEAKEDAQKQGFADALMKPFTPESVEDFVMKFFDRQELLTREENVLVVGEFAGKDDKADRYLDKLKTLFEPAMQQVAAACFDEVIVDASRVPPALGKFATLVAHVEGNARSLGLAL